MALAIILFCQGVCAQNSRSITLEEALRMAQENRLELKSQAIQVQIAESADDNVRAQWLPQINASADMRWNTQLQSNVLPIGAFGLPGVPADATRTVRFGTPFNNTLSLQAEQKILDANRRVDQQRNANELDRQRNLLEQQQVQARYAAAAAYYDALWQQERVRMARQALDRANVLLETGRTRLQNGALLPNDLDRLKLDSANASATLTRTSHDLDLAFQNLCHQLALPAGSALQLADSLDQLRSSNTALPPARPGERPEVRAEQLAAQANDLNRQKQLARLRPTLSAYGNYTLLQLNDQFNPLEHDTWYPFNYIGLHLSVPVYDGRQAKLAARDFDLRQQANQLNAQKLESDFAFESSQYRTAMLKAELDLDQARESIALAKQIFDTDRLRLQQGVIQPKDLKDSEYARQQAENNYLSAVYNWLVAQLNWRRASGNL